MTAQGHATREEGGEGARDPESAPLCSILPEFSAPAPRQGPEAAALTVLSQGASPSHRLPPAPRALLSMWAPWTLALVCPPRFCFSARQLRPGPRRAKAVGYRRSRSSLAWHQVGPSNSALSQRLHPHNTGPSTPASRETRDTFPAPCFREPFRARAHRHLQPLPRRAPTWGQ